MRTQHAGQSALLLLDAIEVMQAEKVDYAVIGAFALSVHGTVRATRDVDAVIYAQPEQLASLQDAFNTAGFQTDLRYGDMDDPIPGMLVLRDSYDNRVDLLGGLRGLDPQAFARAIEVSFLGVNLRIIGREDFIAMKCFAGGPQDILDARSAYEGAQDQIHLDLLRTVTRRFGRNAADNLEVVLAQ